MTEYERVREQIAEFIGRTLECWDTCCTTEDCGMCYAGADKILSLNGIEIKSDDQSYPEIPRKDIVHIIMGRDTALREAGFIKVIPKEE